MFIKNILNKFRCRNHKNEVLSEGIELPAGIEVNPDNFPMPDNYEEIINQPEYKIIVEKIDLKTYDHILEIGFGNGYLNRIFLKKNDKVAISCLDITKNIDSVSVEKFEPFLKSGYFSIKFQDISKAFFWEYEEYNKIYTINTIHLWDDLDKYFSVLKNIIKTNGVFLNVINIKSCFNKYTLNEIEKITEKYGMKILEIIEIRRNESYCIISEKFKS